jgi:transcriptional regulator with XRE-family HTH domain
VEDDDRNDVLAAARRRLSSPSGSGDEMSRQEVAEAVNAYLWSKYRQLERADSTYIGHLEQGRYRWPSARRREAIRAVLGVSTDAELGFFYRARGPVPRGQIRPLRESSHGRSRGATAAWTAIEGHQPAVGPWHAAGELLDVIAAGNEDSGRGDPVRGEDPASAQIRRRSLLWGMATITTAAALFGPENGHRRRIGATDVLRLTALTALYRSMDYEFGGGALVADVGAFAESASALLNQIVSDKLRPQLLAAIANARYLAAWTAFDATLHADAQRHFIVAERCALEADDRLLLAYIRYGQARQLQHLRHNRDAVDILLRAHHQLDPTPGMLATLRGAEAASRAALGDTDGARRALGESSDAFAAIDAGSEPEWLGFLDEGELLAQYGRVYRDLARVDRRHGDAAVQWVSDAIASFGSQNLRSTVLNQVGLSSAYFLAGAPELAIRAGRTAAQQAPSLTSKRVIDRIANLRRDARDQIHRADVAAFVRTLPRPVTVAA